MIPYELPLSPTLQKHWRLAVTVVLVIAAFGAGWKAHRPATVVKTETVAADESAGLDLRQKSTTVQEPKTLSRKRVVVRERINPGTGQVEERTTTTDTSQLDVGKKTSTTETGEKVKDDLHVKTAESVRVTDVPRLHAFVEAGPTLSLATGQLGVSVVAGASYRVLGPVYVGGNVIVPVVPNPLPPTLQVVVGVGL